MRKKNILICIDWFLPAYKAGGPIQSISNMVTHLKNELDFWIYTSNRDLNEKLDLHPESLNRWIKKDGINIMYADSSHQNVKFIKHLLNTHNFDKVYLNSFFSLKFSILPIILAKKQNIKIILAPRGMLGEGALAIKSFKKKWFLKIFKTISFYKNIIWHATDASECDEIKLHFGKYQNVIVAPNLSKKIFQSVPLKTKQQDHLKLFFLSRIAIKKNLLGAIQIFSLLPKSVTIEFTIIGPIDEINYWKECQSKLRDLPNNVKVSYLGAIPNHELTTILNDQHVMILPTRHENFGHVIMESWQAGCPVIISKHTPWKNLESKQLGFDLDNNNINSYVKAICNFAKMDQIDFDEWSEASFNFGKAFSENEVLLNKTKQLFL
jgi:glycosyltransferase involved in cell wall biosynthesis